LITAPSGISGAIFLYLSNKIFHIEQKLIISKTFFNFFSYISLGIIAVILFLVYEKITPQELNFYILIFAILLLTIRLFIRISYKRQNSKNLTGG